VFVSNAIKLLTVEHEELTQRTNRRSGRADEARRARLILLLDAGHTWASIREKLDCTDSFIDRWGKRFAAERLGGLFSRHAGQLPTTLTPALEARILEWSVKRKTPRWLDALEYAQTRCSIERQSHDGGASVAQACVETASA
jgi:transposase